MRDLSSLSPSKRQVYDDIQSHGWHVVLVQNNERTSGWAFSIGLHATFDHPEIVIFGLPKRIMHIIVNDIGEAVRNGQRFTPGQSSDAFLEGYECRFESVCTRWYRPFLGYAVWFYDGVRFPVLQCVWPDKEQLWPWDPASTADWSTIQPVLSREDLESSGAAIYMETLQEPDGEAG